MVSERIRCGNEFKHLHDFSNYRGANRGADSCEGDQRGGERDEQHRDFDGEFGCADGSDDYAAARERDCDGGTIGDVYGDGYRHGAADLSVVLERIRCGNEFKHLHDFANYAGANRRANSRYGDEHGRSRDQPDRDADRECGADQYGERADVSQRRGAHGAEPERKHVDHGECEIREFRAGGEFVGGCGVDAEPLYVSNLTLVGGVHHVVYVVTENDSVYAFDADTFAQLWHVSVLGANETASDNRGCGQVSPIIGITSTPVIDLSAGTHGEIFLVAMSLDNSGKLSPAVARAGPDYRRRNQRQSDDVQATFPTTSGTTTFDPKQYKERAALLLLNGVIYTTWASHCDDNPYTGWIMGYNETTLQQSSVLNVTPNGSEGAIWMAGDGPAADSSGNIYFLDANGTFRRHAEQQRISRAW